MVRLPTLLAVSRAEIRTNTRLVRYWVSTVILVLAAFVMFWQFTGLHRDLSGLSATMGTMGPRHLLTWVGLDLLLVSVVGLLFLAFDVRARDERDRIIEVLESRPLSNVEYLIGKVAGLVFVIWIPLLAIAVLFEAFGLVASNYDSVEPFSLLGFLFSSFTALLLWCSIIVVVSVVVRSRTLVAIVSLVLLGLQFWILIELPVHQQPWFSTMPTFDLASDILPRVAAEGSVTRIAAYWIMASSFLCLACALYPRRDNNSVAMMVAASAGLLALSVAVLGIEARLDNSTMEQRAVWRSAHQAKQALPRADMQSLSGSLTIQPGDLISMQLDLEIQAPKNQALAAIVFTLNPGIAVTGVRLPEGNVRWTHDSGLLEIIPKQVIAPGAKTVISLEASGIPNEHFGYLDTSVGVPERDFSQAQIGMLGSKASVFESTYVAMMPGAHWLPSTGTDVPQNDPRTHPDDYYTLDLKVTIPADWLVAGPGRRQKLHIGQDVARYHFKSKSPLPHVGLIASRFERRKMVTAGIEFEVLFYPDHDRNLKFFEDSQESIRVRLNELFTNAEDLGLPYPYDGLSLVETPSILRGYGGGWMMDSVQSMPGVILLRESGLPTARFESMSLNPKSLNDGERRMAINKLAALEQYLENDFAGGNLFTEGSRNFFRFQTSAVGEGAHVLNFVLDDLASQLLTGKRGHFSMHEFSQSQDIVMVEAIFRGRKGSFVESVRHESSKGTAVWDRALDSPLVDLQPSEAPRLSFDLLELKSAAITRLILDGLGRTRTAALLAELVNQYRGRTFHLSDLYRIAADLDIELEPLLGDWLYDAALPGFLLSPVTSVRLMDDDRGNPQYQTQVSIRNDESTPGWLQLRYQWGSVKEPVWDVSDPIHVPGHTSLVVGIITPTPLFQFWTQPYLALNRVAQRIPLPTVDSEKQIHAAPFSGVRASDWQPDNSADIIVDDLDSGFTVSRAEPEKAARTDDSVICWNLLCIGSIGGDTIDLDQGVPEYLGSGYVEHWSREAYPDSWGRYRHTHALIHLGKGASRATFSALLPHSGRWRLFYYLGTNTKTENGDSRFYPGRLLRSHLGTHNLTLVSNGTRQPIEFDGQLATFGWNDLGEFQLPAGKTILEVADVTTGDIVIADAIRWRPATLPK